MIKVSELIEQLQELREKHGDVDVMIDPQINCAGPWTADKAVFREVEDDEDYPEDYNMPAGYKYIEIACWN